MERKEAVYKGLEFIPVFYVDDTLTSPDYFQISEFPTRLTAGKNLFKLRGHPTNLKVGGVLGIEVLDYNGDPIYSEVLDYIDEDNSRVISIYIYEDTSPGDCSITLIAEANTIEGAPAPAEWQGKPNIRWTRTVPVNPMVANISEIIFEKLPTVKISEEIGVQLDRQYTNGQFPTYTTGTVKLTTLNGQPVIELTGGEFESDMKTGTITVASPVNPSPTPAFPISTTPYVSTIKKILTPTTALLDKEYIVYSSESIFPHIYTEFEDSAFSLSYEATPTYVTTENSQSFALVEIENLDPGTGDVSRVKIYTNNKGTVGDYEQINDVELTETEILVVNTASLFPDQSVGTFVTQSTIDTYWEGHTYLGRTESTAPTLTWTTESLDLAALIDSSTDITANNHVLTFQVKDAYQGLFIATSSYKVTVDALGTRSTVSSNNDPVLGIYISGSAFDYDTTDLFNQELPKILGKRIGELRVTDSNSERFDDVSFSFESNKRGNGVVIFVVESGVWQISDVRTTTDNDVGYTPNYTRLKTFVETTHKIDNQITFKIEYYNVDGVASKQINYVYDKNWEGGNRYVDGDFSMLTGSLYVANSLESGVAITGDSNTGFVRSLGYQGFESGFPGFLLWSGSALAGQNTKGGVAYSGVGLELYLDNDSYFRYSTADDELYVATQNFFLGDPNTAFISGSNSNIEISASGFHLTPEGDVTASSFVAQQGGNTLFDSNNEFVDGNNIGRIVYFNRDEYTFTGNLETSPQTASIFETFILPGETNMQYSFTTEYNNADSGIREVKGEFYIQSAFFSASNPNSNNYYDTWNTPQKLHTGFKTIITSVAGTSTEGTSQNIDITGTDTMGDYQGRYVRIYFIASMTSGGNGSSVFKVKGQVFRTSRSVGGSTEPPANIIR